MSPSPRLLLLAFGGLLVAALPTVSGAALWPAVIALWGVLLLGTLVDVFALLRKVRLEVEVPAHVGVGAPLELGVRIHAPRGVKAALRQEVDAPLEPGEDRLVKAPAGSSRHRLEASAPRRGAGRVEALWTRVDGPLGFFRRIDRHEVGETVKVVPNAERVRELALAHFGAQRFGGVHVTKRVGEGGEFHALETYEAGMDLRQVDWKASARHQSLRVRRYRLEQNQRLILCVDGGRLMADAIDGLQRVDHAIHAALLLSRVALKAGDLVGLHAYGESPRTWIAPRGGMRHMARISRGVAAVGARSEETNHVLGIHGLLGKLKRRALIVVFTEFSDSTTAELMVENLGHLAKRHLVVFVALDDPALAEPMSALPGDATTMARAVVASGLQQDRQRVLRRLRRMGVDVVSGPPGPAALALLERYVHIKRRGLIG